MFNIQAKKRFSQNFLKNSYYKQKLASAWIDFINRFPTTKKVIEIGPGTGLLTQEILKKISLSVILIELDPEMVGFLKQKFSEEIARKKLAIFHKDALKIAKNSSIFFEESVIVSNLPYNVGSRILIELSINAPQVAFYVLLQQEVVDKILKVNKNCLFGMWLRLIYGFESGVKIPASAFSPEPKVTSAALAAFPKKLPEYLNTTQKRQLAFDTLKKILISPRKTLANNMKYLNLSKEKIVDYFNLYGYQSSLRLDNSNYESMLIQILSYIKST